MKHWLLALPLGLLVAPAFGQKMEYTLQPWATWSQYAGDGTRASTTINDANYNDSAPPTQAVNPFGSNMGWAGGLAVRGTYATKFNLLGSVGLGYEAYNTRSDVTGVGYYSATPGQPPQQGAALSGNGLVHVYTQAALAFAQVGYRLGGEHAVSLDVLAGPELGYLTAAHELGEGVGARGSWKSDLSRTAILTNKLGFRLRGDVIFWVKHIGLTAGYSYGFTNHQPATGNGVTTPDAELRIARAGLAFRFN